MPKSTSWMRRGAVLATLLWISANLLGLGRFPTVFTDEAENANHAYNAAYHGVAVFSLYDDIYPSSLYPLRQAWPVVIRPFFVQPLALFIRVAGFGLEKARLFSFLICLLTLMLLGWTAWRWAGEKAAWVSTFVLALYFPFLYSAHSIRPEMLLTFFGLCSFCVTLHAIQKGEAAWAALAGILAGLSPGVHTNGIVIAFSVLGLFLLERQWRASLLAFLGMGLGLVLFGLAADWERFIPGYMALFFQEFTRPPLLMHHGNPLPILLSETARYFGLWIMGDWQGGAVFARVLAAEHLFFIAVVIAGCLRPGPWRPAARFAALLMLGYACVVGQKATNYLSVIGPYFAMSVAGWFLASHPKINSKIIDRSEAYRLGLAWAGRGILFTSLIATILFSVGVARYRPAYSKLCQTLASQMEPGARVAGPQELWIGLSSYDYRDLGALMWHRLLLAEKNLWSPLERWRPTYVIVDRGMARRWIACSRQLKKPAMQAPTGFLPWPHEVLSVLPVGPAYREELVLLKIEWPASRRS